MERLADDLWRIVFAFAGPAAGARQVAARARTLDEFLKDRLASEPRVDHYSESTTIDDGVANTRAHVELVHALRTVSRQWRDIITYGSTRQLALCIATRMGTISSGPRRCGAGMRAAATIGRIRSSTSRVLRARV